MAHSYATGRSLTSRNQGNMLQRSASGCAMNLLRSMRPSPTFRVPGRTTRVWPAALLAAVALLCALSPAGRADPQPINPPLGPFINLNATHFVDSHSFSTNDRVLTTPYFYWYDVYTSAHLIDPDGTDALTDHPARTNDFSFRSVAWHKGELRDVRDAGIDVVLPVYWGEPSQRLPHQPVSAQPWSYAGIPPLVKAREELLAEGFDPPRIGMFYDTSTLQFNQAGTRVDLTTPAGWQWFYESVRDYFSLVPPRHWAMIDGRPIIFLYSAAFALRQDQGCLDYLRTAFQRDFGGRSPYVVREISWSGISDGVYAWGGALGLRNPGVASLGPGYDHAAVQGRDPLVVSREAGAFFARNWEKFLRRPSKLAMIETWNEFHEGTDIADSREYGRQYIQLNRKYADMFKAGVVPPAPPGSFAGARLLSIDLGATNHEAGLMQFESADGVTVVTNLAGSACRALAPTPYGGHFLYLRVDDAFKWAETMELQVVVEFFDAAPGDLSLQFDGSDPNAPFQGAYTPSPEVVKLSGSRAWRTAVFTLRQARLLTRQNGGADLRLESSVLGTGVRRIQIIRPGLRVQTRPPAQNPEIQLFAAPGGRYALEATSDFQGWWELTQLVPLDAVASFVDHGATMPPMRFYRARKQ